MQYRKLARDIHLGIIVIRVSDLKTHRVDIQRIILLRELGEIAASKYLLELSREAEEGNITGPPPIKSEGPD